MAASISGSGGGGGGSTHSAEDIGWTPLHDPDGRLFFRNPLTGATVWAATAGRGGGGVRPAAPPPDAAEEDGEQETQHYAAMALPGSPLPFHVPALSMSSSSFGVASGARPRRPPPHFADDAAWRLAAAGAPRRALRAAGGLQLPPPLPPPPPAAAVRAWRGAAPPRPSRVADAAWPAVPAAIAAGYRGEDAEDAAAASTPGSALSPSSLGEGSWCSDSAAAAASPLGSPAATALFGGMGLFGHCAGQRRSRAPLQRGAHALPLAPGSPAGARAATARLASLLPQRAAVVADAAALAAAATGGGHTDRSLEAAEHGRRGEAARERGGSCASPMSVEARVCAGSGAAADAGRSHAAAAAAAAVAAHTPGRAPLFVALSLEERAGWLQRVLGELAAALLLRSRQLAQLYWLPRHREPSPARPAAAAAAAAGAALLIGAAAASPQLVEGRAGAAAWRHGAAPSAIAAERPGAPPSVAAAAAAAAPAAWADEEAPSTPSAARASPALLPSALRGAAYGLARLPLWYEPAAAAGAGAAAGVAGGGSLSAGDVEPPPGSLVERLFAPQRIARMQAQHGSAAELAAAAGGATPVPAGPTAPRSPLQSPVAPQRHEERPLPSPAALMSTARTAGGAESARRGELSAPAIELAVAAE